jgi:hypothetical protein
MKIALNEPVIPDVKSSWMGHADNIVIFLYTTLEMQISSCTVPSLMCLNY